MDKVTSKPLYHSHFSRQDRNIVENEQVSGARPIKAKPNHAKSLTSKDEKIKLSRQATDTGLTKCLHLHTTSFKSQR